MPKIQILTLDCHSCRRQRKGLLFRLVWPKSAGAV